MPEKVTAMTESTALADNDLIMVIDDSTGTPDNVKVSLATLKAFVASTGGGGSTGALSVIASASPSSAADASLSFSTGYGMFKLSGWVTPSSTAGVQLQLQCNDGGGFDTTSEYNGAWEIQADGAKADGALGAVGFLPLSRDDFQFVGSTEGIQFEIQISRAPDAAHTGFKIETQYLSVNVVDYCYWWCTGSHTVASSLTQVRLQFSSGNIADGEIRLIGIP